MKSPSYTLKLILLIFIFWYVPATKLPARTPFRSNILMAAQQENDPVKKIQLYYTGGEKYKKQNTDSAFIFYNAGLSESVKLQQDSLIGIGYYYLALLEAQLNNYRPALTYADSAFNHLKHTGSYQHLAELKHLKSIIFIKHLSAETRQNRTAIKQQQRTSNILFVAVIIIIFFSALLFNRFQLKKKIENQQTLLNERKRISHELHDDLGSQLCTAKLFLANLKHKTDCNGDKEVIENSLSLIDGCIKDLRFIMNDLQTPVLLENGYIAATTALVNKVNRLKQINFCLSHNGIQERIGQQKENNLFRITQELINNTLKYAHAKNVTIDVLNRNNNIILMYEDDGNGCNLQSATKGYGLNNIQSRSRSLGGTVAFDSYPGAGFRAVVEIPLLYA